MALQGKGFYPVKLAVIPRSLVWVGLLPSRTELLCRSLFGLPVVSGAAAVDPLAWVWSCFAGRGRRSLRVWSRWYRLDGAELSRSGFVGLHRSRLPLAHSSCSSAWLGYGDGCVVGSLGL